MFSPYIVYTFTALLFGLKSANCFYVNYVCSLRSSDSGARPSISCTRICASNCICVYVFVCKYVTIYHSHVVRHRLRMYCMYTYVSMSHSIVVYQYLDSFIRSCLFWFCLRVSQFDLFSSFVFAIVFMHNYCYTFISGKYAYGLYRM